MALQTSGAISLANIQTEFGGSNPISLSEYYGVASGIPASGTISIGDFYGKSSATLFPIGTYYAQEPPAEAVIVGLYYEDDGFVELSSAIDLRVIKTASGFEVRAGLGHDPSSYHYGYMQDGDYNEIQLTNASDVLLFELTSATVDALKVDYRTTVTLEEDTGAYADFSTGNNETPAATYNITDNAWQTLSNGQSMGKRFKAWTHTVDPYTYGENSARVWATIEIDVWARASGRVDTLLATLLFTMDPAVESITY